MKERVIIQIFCNSYSIPFSSDRAYPQKNLLNNQAKVLLKSNII